MGLTLAALLAATMGAVEVDWDTAALKLDDAGRVVSLTDRASGRQMAVPGQPFAQLTTAQGTLRPTSARRDGEQVVLGFEGGVEVAYRVSTGPGFSLWAVDGVTGLPLDQLDTAQWCNLRLDGPTTLATVLNAAYDDQFATAVMATTVGVQGVLLNQAGLGGNHAGVSHTFQPEAERVKEGHTAARFAATSTRETGDGWSLRSQPFGKPLDLTGLVAVKAWVYGDGKGEQLKIQLFDERGGYRDDYIPISFTGWREVTCDTPALQTIDLSTVRRVSFYYNSLPAKSQVETVIDHVRAVLPGGKEVLLADFEESDSPLWDARGVALRAQSYQRHGVLPAGFGLIAAPRAKFEASIEAFEQAAGLPCPRPGGVWSKRSPWVKRSYLFITAFGEADSDEVIDWAHRGGFGMVLVGGGSWNRTHGHHEINPRYFPDGLPSLQRTFDRLRAAGLRGGLHFLAPAVYPDDAYVTPRPDPRLFKDKLTSLAADVDAEATGLPVVDKPEGYPAEDGGYLGDGTWLQVGDELIQYGSLGLEPPFGFGACRRGGLGSSAVPHAKGTAVAHLQRSYGYFLFDLDSTLAQEVTGRVCEVANAIGADMLYFDGSERLQGDHWYYNAKLQRMYHDGLTNKNTLLQGSSYSQNSWHLISRTASADGHGDVKGYLDERTPSFAWYAANLMPLDIGWYYVYDPEVTADQFEYILGKCLAFDSSLSLQTNPHQLRTHPEMGAIFDLVNTYERLRLSGKVPETIRERLRGPGQEFRLLRDPLRLRRTVYGPWQEVEPDQPFEVEPAVDGARLGVQIRCGALTRPGPAYQSEQAITLETFDDLAPFTKDPKNQFEVFVIGPGKAGAVSEGVSQELAIVPEGVDGGKCARYTATSERVDDAGWSSIGRRFDPPLDLSQHRGIGFWLKGDGHGGQFKLQLRDDKGATDYYIHNDFTTWRYIQVLRPDKPSPLPIDNGNIQYLLLYYNGLPAKTTVTCWVDDVKALMDLDEASLAEPTLVVGDRRVTFPTTLKQGERLVWYPGEAPEVIPAVAGERRRLPEIPMLPLGAKTSAILTTDQAALARVSLRLVQEGTEELPLPEEALATELAPLKD